MRSGFMPSSYLERHLMALTIPKSLPVLQTPLNRFVLTPLTDNHHPALASILLDERLWEKGYGDGEWRPSQPFETDSFIASSFTPYKVFAVMTNPDYFGSSFLVGTTGITQIVQSDARVRMGRTLLSPDIWGKGANHEIKLAVLTWLFENGTERLECLVDGKNTQSSSSLLKFGFSHEGLMRKYSKRLDGTWKDISLYSLLSEEWPDVSQRNISRIQIPSA